MDEFNYAITIRKDVFEGEELFEATVEGFPDLADYAKHPGEAYWLAIDSIRALRADDDA